MQDLIREILVKSSWAIKSFTSVHTLSLKVKQMKIGNVTEHCSIWGFASNLYTIFRNSFKVVWG